MCRISFVSQPAILLKKKFEIRALQQIKELNDKQKIEQEIYNILDDARRIIITELDNDFQRELSYQLNLAYYLWNKNDPILLSFVKTAISILVGSDEYEKSSIHGENLSVSQSTNGSLSKTKAYPNASAKSTSKISGSNLNKGREKSRFRSFLGLIWFEKKQPRNLLVAKKLRKQVEFALSSDTPQPLFLLLGLGSFIFAFGIIPLLLLGVKESFEPPHVKITPTSMSDFTVQPDKDIRLIFQGENKEEEVKKDKELSVSVMEVDEFEEIVKEETEYLTDEVREEILDSLTRPISASLREVLSEELEKDLITQEFRKELKGAITAAIEKELSSSVQSASPSIEESASPSIEESASQFIQDLEQGGVIEDAIEDSFRNNDNFNKHVKELLGDEEILHDKFLEAIDPNTVKEVVRNLAYKKTDESIQSQNNQTASENQDSNFLENFDIDWTLFTIVIIGGACGSFTSVILRAQNVAPQSAIGRLDLFLTGFLKPITGIMFALFLFAILEANMLPIDTTTHEQQGQPVKQTYLYLALSFIAGFSERLVQDVLVKAEQTMAGSSMVKYGKD